MRIIALLFSLICSATLMHAQKSGFDVNVVLHSKSSVGVEVFLDNTDQSFLSDTKGKIQVRNIEEEDGRFT